jgi:DNA-directed RNA polymerase specialized sigma24 family protein
LRSHHPNPRSTLSGSAATPFSLFSDLNDEQLSDIIQILKKELDKRHSPQYLQSETVPIEIFSLKLAPAEALVKYLKEELGLRFSEMAKKLNRDERGLWTTYNRACKKMKTRFVIKDTACAIPLNIFSERGRSNLENLLLYLHDVEKWSFNSISEKLAKSYPTIYTCYRRAKKKGGEL